MNEIALVIEALSSCAIGGNEFAEELLALHDSDYEAFILRCREEGFLK